MEQIPNFETLRRFSDGWNLRMEGSSAGSGDASSSQNSLAGSVEFLLKDCYHGVRARLFTSNTERNPFRRFQKCLATKNNCGFYAWIDDDLPPFQKEFLRNMMRMNRSLDEQLKCKTILVNLLSENLRLKSDESGNSDGVGDDDARGVADREAMIEMRNTVWRLQMLLFSFLGIVVVFIVYVAYL